jgi:hypothetical protein
MVSARGVTSPGRLEAYWKLDESSGRIAEDSSGHGITGRFNKEPNLLARSNGRGDNFGHGGQCRRRPGTRACRRRGCQQPTNTPLHELIHTVHTPCEISSDLTDKYIPIAAAGVGLLVAVACIGLWLYGGGLLWLFVSLGAGLLLPTSTSPRSTFGWSP